MKFCAALTTATLIVAATFDSAMGLAKYLDELPNGTSFTQELGHPDDDSSKNTKFATAFAAAGHSWTTEFCKATFPGSTMTNGAAFGDPCCTWKKGGKPDFTVTPFTTTPGKATVCASGGSSTGSTVTEAPSTDTPATDTPSVTTEAPTTATPAMTTEAPTSTTPSVTEAPSTNTPSTVDPTTDPPIASASGSDSSSNGFPHPGGCRVKPHHGGRRHHDGKHGAGGKHGSGARQSRLRH